MDPEFSKAFAYAEKFEIWESTNWLNSEKTIKVVVYKRKRFRCDTKDRADPQALKNLGYKLRTIIDHRDFDIRHMG